MTSNDLGCRCWLRGLALDGLSKSIILYRITAWLTRVVHHTRTRIILTSVLGALALLLIIHGILQQFQQVRGAYRANVGQVLGAAKHLQYPEPDKQYPEPDKQNTDFVEFITVETLVGYFGAPFFDVLSAIV